MNKKLYHTCVICKHLILVNPLKYKDGQAHAMCLKILIPRGAISEALIKPVPQRS